MDHEEYQYLNIIKDLLSNGIERKTRNGVTKSLFSRNLTFDLKNGFPLITTKKVFFRGVFEELMFFLRGETNTKKLEEKGINIWKGNTSREFLDSVGLKNYKEGDMGYMYGYQMRSFNKSENNKGVDQLDYIIKTILEDPFSRRIIMTVYNPAQVHLGCLYPCHSIVIQFYINEIDGKYYVSQQTYIRSQDVICGQPFNIASSALLSMLLCHHLNHLTSSDKYIPDMLHITLGDYHIYEEHYEVAKEQIIRDPYKFPKLKINILHDKIEDYEYENIELVDYKYHPSIKAQMIA